MMRSTPEEMLVGVRHVPFTWDGKPIGYVEKLEGENAARKAHSTFMKRKKAFEAMTAKSRFNGQQTTKNRLKGGK